MLIRPASVGSFEGLRNFVLKLPFSYRRPGRRVTTACDLDSQ